MQLRLVESLTTEDHFESSFTHRIIPQFSGHSLDFTFLILLPSFYSPRLTHLMFFRILPLEVFWLRLIPESQETKANSPRGAKAVTEDKAIL